jgi:tetratricopeptide (TPR) repeat protein
LAASESAAALAAVGRLLKEWQSRSVAQFPERAVKWVRGSRGAQLAAAGLALFALAALCWRFSGAFRAARSRPTLVVFANKSAPLAGSFEETLASAPVQQLVRAHFALRRLDAAQNQQVFRRYIGSAGALGSAVVDESKPEPDVLAVLPGYADVDRFSAFLDTVAGNLVKLRRLRDSPKPTGTDTLVLGELYTKQGSLERARRCFESVRAPDSAFAAALERLARLDVDAGSPQAARSELEQARSNMPPAAADRLLVTEALILSSERRVGSAIALLTKSLPALPAGDEAARGWLLLGGLEHELGQDERALAALEKVQSETQDSDLLRAAAEQTLHISHPEPGHVH